MKLTLLALVCALSGTAVSVNLDATCSKDADCTATTDNSECSNDYKNCDNGACKCKSGYTESSSAANTCLKDVTHGQACDATKNCIGGTECGGSSNTCDCPSGETYSSALSMCITTGLKVIGGECSSVSDCYGSAGGMVECVANSGSSSPLYCRCKSGYITEKSTCRTPYVGESCTSAVGCTVQISTGDSSQETETCQSSTCTCPSTAEKISSTVQGTTYSVCLTKSSDAKAAGATCSAYNECASHYCAICEGESTKKCLELKDSGASQVVGTGMMSIVLIVLSLTVM